MNINKLIELSQKPQLFERSETPFWDDPQISKNMLAAHLNPDFDAASRKMATIDASVEWLVNDLFGEQDLKILDLGCGPGLYASRLAKYGYSVTGIDYSQRSINYARKQAEKDELEIEYIYQNYLTIDYDSEFDVIMLVYCDLGALTNDERDLLLSKIYRALKPGGLFVFDVFSDKNKTEDDLARSWDVRESGFWKPEPHLALTETFLYPEDDTYLDQTIVMTEDGEIDIYRVYDHFYTKPTLTKLLDQTDFENYKFYSNIMGEEYSTDSKTLAVVTEKI